MHKSATKCNETIGKWCKNKHGASKIIDTFEMYQRHIATKEHINQDHHAVTTVLGTEVEVTDLGHHHQGDTIVQRTKEPNDPEPPTEHMTTKMMKRKWGRHA
jgi:hypothetical protein